MQTGASRVADDRTTNSHKYRRTFKKLEKPYRHDLLRPGDFEDEDKDASDASL